MKRIISLLIAFVFIISTFALVACGSNETTATTTKGNTPVSTTTPSGEKEATTAGNIPSVTTIDNTPTSTNGPVTTTSTPDIPSIPTENDGTAKHPDYMDVNFGGKTFTLLQQENCTGWERRDFYVEATGDENLVQEAIIKRNSVVEFNYNCKIAYVLAEAPGTVIANDIAVGDSNYEFVSYEYSNASYGGNFYNLGSIGLSLDAEWYNQNFINAFGTKDNGRTKIYTISGPFNLHDYRASWALFFNKSVYETLLSTGKTSIDLYQTVRDGKWTVDVMYEIMQAASSDVNGDQQMTYNDGDVFGFIDGNKSYTTAAIYFAIGGFGLLNNEDGSKSAMTVNNTDVPALSTAIDSAARLYDPNYSASIAYSEARNAIVNGQALFVAECLGSILEGVTDENATISYVPYPKANESQTEYRTMVCNRTYGFKVPKSVVNTAQVAQFLDLYAYHSMLITYKANVEYYATQCMCEEEAGEMMNIAFQNLIFDLDYFSSMGTVSAFAGYVGGSKNMISKALSSKGSATQSQADKWVENVLAAQ